MSKQISKDCTLLTRIRALNALCRYLSKGTLKRLPMELITNEFAFSFAPDGWNYFRALIAEYEKRPDTPLENTTFFKFFQHERVRSVRYLNDLLFLHDPERSRKHGYKFYLGTYPWGDHVGGGPWGYHYDQSQEKNTRDLYGYRANIWHHPGDEYPLSLEWNKTIKLYHSIKHGYCPWRYRYLPEVTFLLRRDGEMRAIRYNGQHRLAILSLLGYKKITALLPSAASISAELALWPTTSTIPKVVYQREVVVREEEVKEWHYVKNGYCAPEQALEIFHAFFELNGRERINSLGLPAIY